MMVSSCLDTGFRTQECYHYARGRQLIHATKGSSERAAPPVGRPSYQDLTHQGQAIKKGLRLWPLGVHVLKSTLYSRLQIREPGPRYIHFPWGLDEEWYQQLTAEKLVTHYEKGFPRQEWHKVRPRNEALDCIVLAYAAALIAGIERVNWEAMAQATPQASATTGAPQPSASSAPRPIVTYGTQQGTAQRGVRSPGQGIINRLLER